MTHHNHSHDAPVNLTVAEKLEKLLDHWIKHNEEHATTYLLWADRAKEEGLAEIESLLVEAAEKTNVISKKFEAAFARLSAK